MGFGENNPLSVLLTDSPPQRYCYFLNLWVLRFVKAFKIQNFGVNLHHSLEIVKALENN
ncbi:MAG: hypothetical protein Q4C98_11360 [Capnocytophaga sp.]|nr:hypothetical protein [Capnocytophaga sp.]